MQYYSAYRPGSRGNHRKGAAGFDSAQGKSKLLLLGGFCFQITALPGPDGSGSEWKCR